MKIVNSIINAHLLKIPYVILRMAMLLDKNRALEILIKAFIKNYLREADR